MPPSCRDVRPITISERVKQRGLLPFVLHTQKRAPRHLGVRDRQPLAQKHG